MYAIIDFRLRMEEQQECCGAANVSLDDGIFLQTEETWKSFLQTDDAISFQHNAGELYFEEKDLDGFLRHLARFDIAYVHQVQEHAWASESFGFMIPPTTSSK